MFDDLTVTKLGFYIGKGIDNRVFTHKQEVLENKTDINSLKKTEIKEILDKLLDIQHLIIRHGLSEKETVFTLRPILKLKIRIHKYCLVLFMIWHLIKY